tara:strand:+ start:181 stop:600 length:420 start_codon:yes stop_codon:yes gene_type:complete
VGKNKYIETPERMWELFLEYKKDVKGFPRIKREYVGKDGEKVDTPLERPLTMSGFNLYLWEKYVIHGAENYFANSGGAYDEYSSICTHVREAIRTDQIEGGMVGQYNASITQRLNGLSEKSEVKTDASINILNIDPLAD